MQAGIQGAVFCEGEECCRRGGIARLIFPRNLCQTDIESRFQFFFSNIPWFVFFRVEVAQQGVVLW